MIQFGSWPNDIDRLRETFRRAQPFEHVEIPNFFRLGDAEQLVHAFPHIDETWHHYDNPIEKKYTLGDFSGAPRVITDAFQYLQSEQTIGLLRQLTGIFDLENDPYLHGAGLHAYPARGKLDVHLDYSIHPLTGKERRLNLIVYLNKNWKPEYGGHLQFWNAAVTECAQVIAPEFNTAVLFRTSDLSYHGLPTPLACPSNEFRRSLAIYYVSPARPTATPRFKAEYVPLPHQPVSPSLARLYSIRKHRRIVPDDLVDWPAWRDEGKGFW